MTFVVFAVLAVSIFLALVCAIYLFARRWL
jgi:hypothetical protein